MARTTKSRYQGSRRTGALTINRHTRTFCPATGKVRLRDSHQAAHALQGARRVASLELFQTGHSNRRETSFYKCASCAGYHLTSETYRDPEEWRRFCQARWEAERMAEAAADAERAASAARSRAALMSAVHAATRQTDMTCAA
ncbi:hypothetical protein [Microbacterium sp. LWO12-1.2]|uniref:hypothetical protein n=1 Tax=Microbacterium sp. LWO12-1.2 TaxID=3135261 RepID=UPI00343337A7